MDTIALESRLDQLFVLHQELTSAPKLTINIALEADRLLGRTDVSRSFFSTEKNTAKNQTALEEMHKGIIAAIIAAVIIVIGLISNLLSGKSSGGGGGGAMVTTRHVAAITKTLYEQKIDKITVSHSFEEALDKAMFRYSQNNRRPRAIALLFNERYFEAFTELEKKNVGSNVERSILMLDELRTSVRAMIDEADRDEGMDDAKAAALTAQIEAKCEPSFVKAEANVDMAFLDLQACREALDSAGKTFPDQHKAKVLHAFKVITFAVENGHMAQMVTLEEKGIKALEALKKVLEDDQAKLKEMDAHDIQQSAMGILKVRRRHVMLTGKAVKTFELQNRIISMLLDDANDACGILIDVVREARGDYARHPDARKDNQWKQAETDALEKLSAIRAVFKLNT